LLFLSFLSLFLSSFAPPPVLPPTKMVCWTPASLLSALRIASIGSAMTRKIAFGTVNLAEKTRSAKIRTPLWFFWRSPLMAVSVSRECAYLAIALRFTTSAFFFARGGSTSKHSSGPKDLSTCSTTTASSSSSSRQPPVTSPRVIDDGDRFERFRTKVESCFSVTRLDSPPIQTENVCRPRTLLLLLLPGGKNLAESVLPSKVKTAPSHAAAAARAARTSPKRVHAGFDGAYHITFSVTSCVKIAPPCTLANDTITTASFFFFFFLSSSLPPSCRRPPPLTLCCCL
jgi:hypothetical protein